jgi:hypothetical protein
MELEGNMIKDIGLRTKVEDAYPTQVVRGAWEGSFTAPVTDYVPLSHVVPAGQQLKILFLRVWTQESTGARFYIRQVNPTATGQTGSVEAYPVVGSAPEGYVDYPMLEAAGAEVLRGSLKDPVHVLEGSISFGILDTPTPATGSRYGIVWWGVESRWD